MTSYPIDSALPELTTALLKNSSAVLQAPPGAGKTTRVPLALLRTVPLENGRIIMLEPRRLAAVNAAHWMAGLLNEQVGDTVGYRIRFDRRVSGSTRIEVVTEGILTRRMQEDPGLDGVAMVIFDEFHERSIHADLALALCLDIQRNLRADLKLLVMSATLDCAPVADLLGGAPIIASEGKAFPVEVRYVAGGKEKPLREKVGDAVSMALKEAEGDILVFFPGAGEILACKDLLNAKLHREKEQIAVVALFGDMPFDEQEKAILPSAKRKVVLATNIAETSLTIEGVHAVIDSGLTRRLQYDPASGMNRLITMNITKASAEQRRGRAGRLGPGLCYRLYSRHAFESMLPFAAPEIASSDLSSLCLDLAVWGLKEPSSLSWLDAPPSPAWEAARLLLTGLGALDHEGSVTAEGKKMACLPLHPRLGRLLLKSAESGNIHLGADLAAVISERGMLRGTGASDPDLDERLSLLRLWRENRTLPPDADIRALRSIDRTSKQLLRSISGIGRCEGSDYGQTLAPGLLASAFPDRIAKRRKDGLGRFVLSNGRGVRLPLTSSLSGSSFIVAPYLDAGEKAEGTVKLAAEVNEEIIREACASRISGARRVEWDNKSGKIVAAVEERLDRLVLSARILNPTDEEAGAIICDVIRSDPGMLHVGREARQLQARVALCRRLFPEEDWPDLSDKWLFAHPEEWLLSCIAGVRSRQDLGTLDILPALRSLLAWEQKRLLEARAPLGIVVPSGSRVTLDYASGNEPVLAVKLQEMFGLADTPTIAAGRVKVLLHLLSPARRPLQITQDLKGFWDNSYQMVKKEMKGRYPKHPWPDDPWNAIPTRRLKQSGQ